MLTSLILRRGEVPTCLRNKDVTDVRLDAHQTDECVVLQGRARRGSDHTRPQEDALLLQEFLDATHVRIQGVEISQLPVLLLGTADKQQQLADLPPHKRCLLDHQILRRTGDRVAAVYRVEERKYRFI